MPTDTIAQHTPGPWKVAADPCHFDSLTTIYGGEALALKAEVGGTADIAELEANARLIAAAPDLLEVLRECAEVLDNYSDVKDGGDGQPVANSAMSMLREVERVIAKAEGR